MRTPEEVAVAAERAMAQLAEKSEPRWTWDQRFSAALLVVKAPDHLALLELIGQALPHAWAPTSLPTAPATVQAAASAWGGLTANQRLFTLEPTDVPLLFAAWWPWSGGATFSLRISCVGAGDVAAGTALLARLRECFSV